MKKTLKITLFIFLSVVIIVFAMILYASIISSTAKLDESKLINFNNKITFYYDDDTVFANEIDNKNLIEIEYIPSHLKQAFISVEDKRFYKHSGVDYKGLLRATLKNIASFSFKEGGSTISQQLIKNTHLSNDKTLSRKFKEIGLAKKLEKKYSKEEILELYLNTIYFGDGCYGIKNASEYYFSKNPSELTINESAVLAGLIKAPSKYSPTKNIENAIKRKNVVLKKMYEENYISKNEYENNIREEISLNINQTKKDQQYISLAKSSLNSIINLDKNPYKKLNVYTYCDKENQDKIESCYKKINNYQDKSIILLNNNSKIIGYSSSVGEIYRPIGSVIKPIVVYAPAIEQNTVYSITPILDEKTDFNGYSPKNYNDKYLGYVSVKDSLAKSLNVPAVKILNSVGVKNALKYASKTDIPFNENDNHLAIALGATNKGATLSQITSSYSVFNNDGSFYSANAIKKITDENGRVLYIDKTEKNKIFTDDTAYIVSDMLEQAVNDGTAKKLSILPFTLYSKTGTVGNELGNTDAYNVSYNKDYILGVWLGNRDNSYMNKSITGGSLPTDIAFDVWDMLYKNNCPPPKLTCDNVVSLSINKNEYTLNNKILKSSFIDNKKDTFDALFKKNQLDLIPTKQIDLPKINNVELSVNINGISLRLCQKEYVESKIYKLINGKKILVYDTKGKSNVFIDNYISNTTYEYYIIPYYKINDEEIYGNEIKLKKIKTPTNYVGDKWWINEFD